MNVTISGVVYRLTTEVDIYVLLAALRAWARVAEIIFRSQGR